MMSSHAQAHLRVNQELELFNVVSIFEKRNIAFFQNLRLEKTLKNRRLLREQTICNFRHI